jgi:hypothetical protein
MDINTRVIRNNPVWDADTVLKSISLTNAGSPATAVQPIDIEGKYCIISNTGAVSLYVGNDSDGTPAGSPIGVGGPGVVVEPNATLEIACSDNAVLYVRNVSATTAGQVSVLWFK